MLTVKKFMNEDFIEHGFLIRCDNEDCQKEFSQGQIIVFDPE